MVKVKIKGHEVEALSMKTASNRRALQFKNMIVEKLRLVGVKKDDVEIPLESIVTKKVKASVTWYSKNHRMYYSNNSQKTFIENLYLCLKLLEIEINQVVSGKKTITEFVHEFQEDIAVDDERKDAREFLGLEHDNHDLEIIDKKYKELAKEFHPDTPNGSTEKFKKLNHAHKILRRELQ
ncbi:MAG: J domain-containing protein [archaeon]|nr:J domain-containing protein [archaeon]